MQNKKITESIRNFSGPELIFPGLMLLLLLAFAGTQVVAAAATDNDDDLLRLKRGEILTYTIHSEKSGGAARVKALFHGGTDEIWNTIGYCKNEFIYVRGLELCEVLIPGLISTRKHHRVNNNWYTPTIDFVFEATRTSPTHGDFSLVEGNLKILEGQWDLQPLEDSDAIIVTHDIRVRSRFPAPRWLVRRVLKGDLPDMMACVRGLAGASGDDGQLGNDLDRCPGDTMQADK